MNEAPADSCARRSDALTSAKPLEDFRPRTRLPAELARGRATEYWIVMRPRIVVDARLLIVQAA
jgi:hypothetical protein